MKNFDNTESIIKIVKLDINFKGKHAFSLNYIYSLFIWGVKRARLGKYNFEKPKLQDILKMNGNINKDFYCREVCTNI